MEVPFCTLFSGCFRRWRIPRTVTFIQTWWIKNLWIWDSGGFLSVFWGVRWGGWAFSLMGWFLVSTWRVICNLSLRLYMFLNSTGKGYNCTIFGHGTQSHEGFRFIGFWFPWHFHKATPFLSTYDSLLMGSFPKWFDSQESREGSWLLYAYLVVDQQKLKLHQCALMMFLLFWLSMFNFNL